MHVHIWLVDILLQGFQRNFLPDSFSKLETIRQSIQAARLFDQFTLFRHFIDDMLRDTQLDRFRDAQQTVVFFEYFLKAIYFAAIKDITQENQGTFNKSTLGFLSISYPVLVNRLYRHSNASLLG